MSDNGSSAALNRLEVMGAANAKIRAIQERYEREHREYDQRRADEINRIPPVGLYSAQITALRSLVALARASDADTMQVTRTDFDLFKDQWRV